MVIVIACNIIRMPEVKGLISEHNDIYDFVYAVVGRFILNQRNY